jgi:hypothetical protein
MMKRRAAMFRANRTGTVFTVALVVMLAATLTMGVR